MVKSVNTILTVLLLCVVCTANAQDRTEIFVSKSDTAVHYRIPAIAALPDGSVVAVADYRFSRNDIGIVKDGRVDLRVRTSNDNGCGWGEISTVIEGKGKDSPDFMNVGFGDPALVADRKTGRLLLMCAAGNVSFLDGTRECHLRIPRFYSEDGGKTWKEGCLVTDGPTAYSDLTMPDDRHLAVLYETGLETPYERIEWTVYQLQ